ncbi:hypothetical protein FOZ63_002869, partial [Perkinsus olseni]
AERVPKCWSSRMMSILTSWTPRVRAVKEVAHGIGREARESNNILSGMGGQFDKAGNMLKGTMAKLQNMVDSGSGRSMIYLALFVVAMFMFMYLFYRR